MTNQATNKVITAVKIVDAIFLKLMEIALRLVMIVIVITCL